MVTGDELLTVDEIAKRLKVKPDTVRAWLARRLLPRVNAGPRRVRVPARAVEDFISRNTVPARPAAR